MFPTSVVYFCSLHLFFTSVVHFVHLCCTLLFFTSVIIVHLCCTLLLFTCASHFYCFLVFPTSIVYLCCPFVLRTACVRRTFHSSDAKVIIRLELNRRCRRLVPLCCLANLLFFRPPPPLCDSGCVQKFPLQRHESNYKTDTES